MEGGGAGAGGKGEITDYVRKQLEDHSAVRTSSPQRNKRGKQESGIYQEHSALPFPLGVPSRPLPVAAATAALPSIARSLNFTTRHHHQTQTRASSLRRTVTRFAAATWISMPYMSPQTDVLKWGRENKKSFDS